MGVRSTTAGNPARRPGGSRGVHPSSQLNYFALSGVGDPTVFLYNASNHAMADWLTAPADVSAMAWSQDYQHFATGHVDGTISMWDVATGTREYTWQADDAEVHSLDFSADGQRLLSGGTASVAVMWDLVWQ